VTTIAVHPLGALIALAVVAAVISTFYWMLHPPRTKADIEAKQAEAMVHKMVGSIIVVFSEDIHSGHMMVLAARLARRETRRAARRLRHRSAADSPRGRGDAG